eukprot:TRINITY_DN46250_c0_g1_i1.p1 TRINITY_DN46250_c0_g1~~TRINITY_DN46250_c0_g1_i1.p1  ORF type:complete len:615 (-),score=36.57 TRINITY_DN46250_c0_g1_i1:199-1995(-)
MPSLVSIVFFLVWLRCSNSQQIPSIVVNETGPYDGLDAWVSVDFGPLPVQVRHGCWLGVFPASANLTAAPWPQLNGGTSGNVPNTVNSPMKFMDCKDADSSFMTTGSGHLSIRLLNIRQDLVLALFSNGTVYPVLEARSSVLAFVEYRLPMHGHIALVSEQGRMLVQWTSLSEASPTVQWNYQRSGGPYNNSIAGSSVKYDKKDFCGVPANREGYLDSGFQHSVEVEWPLHAQAGERIFYRFGSAMENLWSDERSFEIPPQPGHDVKTYMLVVADVGATEPDNFQSHWSNPLGGASGSCVVSNITYLQMRKAPQSQAVIHIGDISYATGYLAKWELFMDQVEEVASRTPYMVSQGNHERDWPGTGSTGSVDSGGECGIPAQARFRMPTPSRQEALGWYSFDLGAVHVVMMDTELSCGKGSEQLVWLEADLKAVNRSRTPWVVVTGHRPMYAVGSGGSYGPDLSNSFCLGAASSDLETLFLVHEVDLCLWGHVHNALATCPVYKGKCIKKPGASKTRPGFQYLAPVHAVVGNGGMDLSGIAPDPAPWVAWQSNTWGWNTLTADGSWNLKVSFFDERDTVLHEISIESATDASISTIVVV